MKFQKTIIVILIIGLIGCSKKNDEIIINGNIDGNVPDKIEYTVPVDGTWFYGSKKSVVPDSLGNFTISLKTDIASFVTLYIPNQAAAVLLVEPGKKYEIDFHLNSKDKKVNIKGATGEALNLYNSFAHPDFYVLTTSNALLKDSLLMTISSKINTLKEKELLQFQKQLEKQNITKDFYDLAELDRKSYYSALEGAIAKNKYNFQSDGEATQNAQITKLWKKMFEQAPSTDTFNIRSPWSYSLMANYIQFNQYLAVTFDVDKIRKINEQPESHSYQIEEAKKYLKGKPLEYYFASYILSKSFINRDNSKELITLYEKFQKEYPNSNYSSYLTSYLQPIVDFHNKIAESSINPKVQLVENYKNIDTFDELMKTQKGKKVFVDIWGTWCSPCKKEFQQKNKSAQLFKSKDITTLYICEGENSKEKDWTEMIKFYDLEGYHIRTNDKLLADIINRFSKNGSFAYPRYLLIDENGNVVNEQASYPSKIEQLEKEINEDYVW